MVQVSVSAHAASGMIAVGLTEPGAPLPERVRVLDYELAELVADGLGRRLDSAAACGQSPADLDLDAIVADAERILRRGRT